MNVSQEGLVLPEKPTGFFLDGMTGWVTGESFVADDNRGRLPIFRTTDGGKTWLRALIDGFDLKQITFVDHINGWALRHDGVATGGTEHVTLLRTTDGGEIWKPVAQAGTPEPGQLHNYPVEGMKSGVSFVDLHNGWASGGYSNVDRLFLYRTTDGGDTWGQQELPVPERLRKNATRIPILWTVPPWTFPGGRLVLTLSGLCGNAGCAVTFRSRDGGQSWDGTPPLEFPIGGNPVTTFLDPDRCWVAVGDRLYATEDGGQTWIARSTLQDVRTLDFVNVRTGWAILGDDHLFRTDDKGVTWRPVVLGTSTK